MAFEVFLANTDQKVLARECLKKLVKELSSHSTFIDSGDGNGQVTEWLLDDFERTIVIEPNRSLCNDLQDYICTNFASPGSGFRFSCDQDFLTIRRSLF